MKLKNGSGLRFLAPVVALVAIAGLISAPGRAVADHRAGRAVRQAEPVVVVVEGVAHRCSSVWIENRDGTDFVNIRNLVACINAFAGSSHGLQYSWNARAEVMYVSRYIDTATRFELEAWPVEARGRTTVRFRDRMSEAWRTHALGTDHFYESEVGLANMGPFHFFTSAFDMFAKYNAELGRYEVHPGQHAVLKTWERKMVSDNFEWDYDRWVLTLPEPRDGVWWISPHAYREGREFGLEAPGIATDMQVIGEEIVFDTQGLRLRSLVPTGNAEKTVVYDYYPATNTTVVWFRSKDSIETFRDKVAIYGATLGGGPSIPTTTSAVKTAISVAATGAAEGGQVAGAAGAAIGAVAALAYAGDRLLEITVLNACITQGEDTTDDGTPFTVGLVMTDYRTGPLFSHTTGCTVGYTWLPVNSSGNHY